MTQFITFNLDDSLPQIVLERLKDELKDFKGNMDWARYEKIQRFLDQGAGSCILKEPRCAELMQDALRFLDGKRYNLIAWVVMPNHVHFLARFEEGQSISKALHSLKSYTGHELKKTHPELGSVWHQESYDRYIRNEAHYWAAISYIHNNPLASKLCERADQFRWSSAFKQE